MKKMKPLVDSRSYFIISFFTATIFLKFSQSFMATLVEHFFSANIYSFIVSIFACMVFFIYK